MISSKTHLRYIYVQLSSINIITKSHNIYIQRDDNLYLLKVFCRAFALNKKTESDGIFNFFSDLLQFCHGQTQGGSFCCLLSGDVSVEATNVSNSEWWRVKGDERLGRDRGGYWVIAGH